MRPFVVASIYCRSLHSYCNTGTDRDYKAFLQLTRFNRAFAAPADQSQKKNIWPKEFEWPVQTFRFCSQPSSINRGNAYDGSCQRIRKCVLLSQVSVRTQSAAPRSRSGCSVSD
jgi:hypothetical protein